jgi:hypothetical protein
VAGFPEKDTLVLLSDSIKLISIFCLSTLCQRSTLFDIFVLWITVLMLLLKYLD